MSKNHKRKPSKRTKVFYTLAKESSEFYWIGTLRYLSDLAETICTKEVNYVLVPNCVRGDMFIIRCTPKEYDDIRKATEFMYPDLFEWDVKITESVQG